MERRGDGETQPGRRRTRALSGTLGWFGIGLGMAEIAAPHRLAGLIGVKPTARNVAMLRAMGLREIASGVGIVARPESPAWVWSRAAGDAVDLALLERAFQARGTTRERTAAAAFAVLGVAALDLVAGRRTSTERSVTPRPSGPAVKWNTGIHVRKSITIGRPREEIYRFWRNFENLPDFMRHLESVRDEGNGRSHWKASAPAGTSVEWDAEIVDDVVGERIAWSSLPGSTVRNRGTVTFRDAPGDRGTEVLVDLRYDPPGGSVTNAVATLFREAPGQQVQEDLRALKQVMETGEVLIAG
jgi:uncharacterized membrane protein